MATYYVSKKGSDANNGTSPNTAWLTFTKLLDSTGISSGDIAYIEPGIYREVLTVNMTSATVETQIIGDIEGRYFGTSGDIILSAYLLNDETLPSSTSLLNLNGRDFLTFKNITFIGGSAQDAIIKATTTTSTDIKFLNCSFLSLIGTSGANNNNISITIGFGVSANWIINGCTFLCSTPTNWAAIYIVLTTGSGSDYNANIKITNCVFFAPTAVFTNSSGTSAQEGGGVYIYNCTLFGGVNTIQTNGTRIGGSTFTNPVQVKNCLIFNRQSSSVPLVAGELGAIIEDYNIIVGCLTIRTNVRIGPNTVSNGSSFIMLNLFSPSYKNNNKSIFSPINLSANIGAADRTISPLNDINCLSRPKGNPNFLFSGYATSSTATSLSDNTKIFPSGDLVGYTVQIIDGLGIGQTKTINENHTGQFFVDGNWLTNPNTTSKYYIYNGLTSSSGPVSSATNTTLIDSNAKWKTDFWRGYTCKITSGTSSGNSIMISGNNLTILTGFMAWTANPNSTSAYELSWGSGISNSGINYLHATCGCAEVYDTAIQQSGNTISGTSAIQLFGSASHDFNIPVTGGSNNISIMGYYDSLYSGIKPQLLITNCGNVGIDEASGIMIVGPNTWEQISVNIVPSGNGIVTARLLANSTGAMGITYFDSFAIS
mgnify:FL=1